MVCDGYVKYEEAEVDWLVAILETNMEATQFIKSFNFGDTL